MKNGNHRTTAVWVGVGMCLGTALGIALDNMGFICLGIAAGLAVASMKCKSGRGAGNGEFSGE